MLLAWTKRDRKVQNDKRTLDLQICTGQKQVETIRLLQTQTQGVEPRDQEAEPRAMQNNILAGGRLGPNQGTSIGPVNFQNFYVSYHSYASAAIVYWLYKEQVINFFN